MKVRLDHVLVDMEGEELVERVKTKEVDDKGQPKFKETPITLGKICANALMTSPKQPDGSDQKYEKGKLAMKLWPLDEAELSIEELALLKECIGIAYGPLVIVQAWDLLEGK
jgi:hypothetical protein